MRKCALAILPVLLLVVVTQACGAPEEVVGSGKTAEERREVSGISGVEMATIGNLTIQVGNRESLRIVAEDRLLPYLVTEVHGGVLKIYTQGETGLSTFLPVNFYLTVKRLDSILLSSSGDVSISDLHAQDFSAELRSVGDLTMGSLSASTLSVEITGSGDMVVERLTADRLEANLSSMGSLVIAGGSVGEQKITVSGSGDYKAASLESGGAELLLTSMGSATVGDVKASASGTLVKVQVHGSGDVTIGQLTAEKLEVGLSSMGNLDIAGGSVAEQKVTISGSGDYKAKNLESGRAEVYLTSMGSATIRVRDHLKADLSGSGSVRYVGSPAVDSRVTGMGDLEQAR